jgi:hypothetical protein
MNRRAYLRIWAFVAMIVCVGMVAAWPWSYWRENGATVQIPKGHVIGMGIYRGSLAVVWRAPFPGESTFEWFDDPTIDDPSFHVIVNFLWFRDLNGDTGIGLPLWLCAILFGYLGVKGFRRSREPLSGHCTVCGYDMRATPHRCPECGTVAAI